MASNFVSVSQRYKASGQSITLAQGKGDYLESHRNANIDFSLATFELVGTVMNFITINSDS